MGYRKLVFLSVLIVLVFAVTAAATPVDRLLRFPDVHGDKVVFVYAGDLYTASTNGGVATRLTSHEGLEQFPKFSPDGNWIAFNGQYDGSSQVYVIPAEGGEPKQLTWYPSVTLPERFGADHIVYGWTADGKSVIFRSSRAHFDAFIGRMFTVSVEGGLPMPMPMPMSGALSYSPDSKKIAYNRIMRDFRPWKRYKGGMAQDVWIFDLASNEIEKITDWEGTDNFPMWLGNKIYFNTDREKRLNLWVYDVNTKETSKVTDFKDYDVKFPSQGPDSIIFENGGYLYLLDPATGQSRKLDIKLVNDRVLTRPEIVAAESRIEDWDLAKGGERAVVIARGDVFTVPAKNGNVRNITNTPGIREKNAAWSPDGKWIAYLSDRTGEEEIYIRAQDGEGEEIRVTTGGEVTRFELVWSPDSKKIVFSDKSLRLFYVDINEKKVVKIDETKESEIHDYTWSPDSNWVAYSKAHDVTGFRSIYLYSLKDSKVTQVTTQYTSDRDPAFDPEGKYLFFVSFRNFNPNFVNYEFNFYYENMVRPYVITLQADEPSPFAPKSDEVKIEEEKKEGEEAKPEEKKAEAEKKEGEKKEAETKETKIDLEGIGDRIDGFEVPPANYIGLGAVKGVLFYIKFGDGPNSLIAYDLKERKAVDVVSGIRGYSLSPDGSKLMYSTQAGYFITAAAAKAATPGDGKVDLSGLKLQKDPKQEWVNSFNETWRRYRDFFYVPNMHGIDWPKMKQLYGALLPYISHRNDLTYVLSEMVSELSAGHCYVGGGDQPTVSYEGLGLLGATFEPGDNGYYKIKEIYPGENWREDLRSPLTESGVVAKAGEYIIAIDGIELKTNTNPYKLLYGKANRTIELKLNDKPSAEGARKVTVKPIRNEQQLRYNSWVKYNREYVAAKTDGRVGYIHVPDMGFPGLNEFVKWFYGQVDKEGLVCDFRYNGGGFVSQLVLDRLSKELKGMGNSRNFNPGTYPATVFYGHMVGLTNEYAASDGDIVSFYWKEYKLGPLVGKRTWGGVVGIRGFPNLLDGGYAFVPEFGTYDLQSKWIMENYGVDPDIDLDNLPKDVIAGKDPQLDKGIELVLEAMEKDPRKRPPKPTEYPVR